MKRSISGTFPTATSSLLANLGDLADASGIPFNALRTAGNCAIIQPTLEGPAPNQKWTLLSVSIQAGLVFVTGEGRTSINASEDTPSGGVLGNIQAFLLPGESNQSVSPTGRPGTFYQPFTINPLLTIGVSPPPPFDETLAADLWDFTSSQMPPSQQVADGTELLPISASIVPPFPLGMLPGNPPLIGIYMKPSLLQWYSLPNPGMQHYKGLAIFGATYIVNYDDGT